MNAHDLEHAIDARLRRRNVRDLSARDVRAVIVPAADEEPLVPMSYVAFVAHVTRLSATLAVDARFEIWTATSSEIVCLVELKNGAHAIRTIDTSRAMTITPALFMPPNCVISDGGST